MSTSRAISSSRMMTNRRRLSESGLSKLRKMGMLPSGSRIKNSKMAADAMVMAVVLFVLLMGRAAVEAIRVWLCCSSVSN